jgi:tetratricopeptide (TPR) repeat protein
LNLGAAIAVLGLLGMAPAAFAQTDACGNKKMTKKVDKPLAAAQEARTAKNWELVIAKVAEAEAVPVEKSVYDNFWIHEFRGIANVNLKKFPEALVDLDAGFNSPCMDDADKPARIKLLMQIAYQQKDYAKAIEFGNRATAINPDPDIQIYLANAYYITNDFENTRKVSTAVIDKLESSGKTPEETLYRILQSACINLKDNECVVAQIEKLVKHYPKPNYWLDLMNSMMRVSTNDKELLNILRLADGVDAMPEASQYTEMAQLALGQGLPGEAQAIIEKGQQKGIFTPGREKDLATRILEKQDASARAKTTGDADVKLGAAYLSYGQNDKAIEALQRGLGKGGVKSPDEAGLLLGIAYMRTNNKPEAAKAFRTVTQSPIMARIAKLWLMNTGEAGAAGAAG